MARSDGPRSPWGSRVLLAGWVVSLGVLGWLDYDLRHRPPPSTVCTVLLPNGLRYTVQIDRDKVIDPAAARYTYSQLCNESPTPPV